MTRSDARTSGSRLRVQDLRVRYRRSILALDGVDVDVPEGKFVSVLGPNGAGKTTLVRAVLGLLRTHHGAIDGGSITFGARNLIGATPAKIVRSGIAVVPEGRLVFPGLSVIDNLRVGAATRRDRAGIEDDIERILTHLPRIADRRDLRAGYLSGGEQQMLVIGRALMARPTLLVCDEVSLGLAPLAVEATIEQLRRLNEEQGVGILLIEQNVSGALKVSDTSYILESGRVVAHRRSAELEHDPDVAGLFFGDLTDGLAQEAVDQRG